MPLTFRKLTQILSPRRSLFTALAAMFLVCAVFSSARAGTVTGLITNGTDGKPAKGVDVILIQLQGGMTSVADTKTDASGHYKLDNPSIGQQPMLIRAVYRGVMFHQPLIPGKDTVDVTVYEPTSDAKTLQVGSRLIVFQPNGANLLVGEEYSLSNQTKPPLAYFNEKGDFNFQIPESAQLSQVSSWGPSGMPVVQGTINRGPQKYAIAYAFQPGDNGVRLSYVVPYGTNQAKLRFSSDYTIQRVMLVVPPTMQLDSPGFSAAGTEQGYNLFTRDGVSAGLPFEVSLSGTAPPPSTAAHGTAGAGAAGAAGAGADDPQQAQAGAQGPEAGGDQLNGRDSGPTIQAIPNRLDSMKWLLLGGFALLFALGLVFIWRQPVALVAAEGAASSLSAGAASPALSSGAARKQAKLARPAAPPAPSLSALPVRAPEPVAAPAIVQVEQAVERSLDSLKDKLFRLELRRQAGTISDEDYARERATTEQILRELVQG